MINNWEGNRENRANMSLVRFPRRLAAFVILLIIALTSLGLIAANIYTVGVSQVGILVNPYTGEFSGPVAGPTLAWKSVPWVNVVIVSTSVQTIQMVGPGNNINVLTRDNLNVSLDVTIRYQVMAANVITLYKHYPALSWEDNALVPLIRSSVRDVVANYTAPSTVPGSTTHCHRPRPTKRNHHRGPSSGKRHANPGFSKRAVDQQHHLTGRGTNRDHVEFYSSRSLHKHVHRTATVKQTDRSKLVHIRREPERLTDHTHKAMTMKKRNGPAT